MVVLLLDCRAVNSALHPFGVLLFGQGAGIAARAEAAAASEKPTVLNDVQSRSTGVVCARMAGPDFAGVLSGT